MDELRKKLLELFKLPFRYCAKKDAIVDCEDNILFDFLASNYTESIVGLDSDLLHFDLSREVARLLNKELIGEPGCGELPVTETKQCGDSLQKKLGGTPKRLVISTSILRDRSPNPLRQKIKEISQPFIEKMESATAELLSEHFGEIKQHTITILQEWGDDLGDDYEHITRDVIGSKSHRIDTLSEVMQKETADYFCIGVIKPILDNWYTALNEAAEDHYRNEKAKSAMDSAARSEGHKDWDDYIGDLFDLRMSDREREDVNRMVRLAIKMSQKANK